MKRVTLLLIVLLSMLPLNPTADARDVAPAEIMQRTCEIQAGGLRDTAFAIDYDGKVYLVTTRHVAADLPPRDTTIDLLRAGTWKNLHIQRTLFPVSASADIAVLETGPPTAETWSFGFLCWCPHWC